MFKTLVSEIRRRNVLPTVVPYIGLIWLLLQVISVIQPMLNLSPLIGTLTAIILFAGFPVVLYLSWYFNFTLEGLEPIADGEEAITFGAGKWLLLILITLGSGGLGYVYFTDLKEQMVKQEEGLSQIKSVTSIAVLPFRDLSPDKDQGYISEGISEELTALLGKVSQLKVAAASSAFALAEQNLTATDIGRRLQVDVVVSGSLRVTGDRLKIRTELIDSKDGMTLWSETFSRKFKDIFSIEEQISRSIVNLLEDRYLESGQVTTQSKTASTDAYVMYLKGREQYRKQTTESIKGARQFFEQAIALDPEYVAAYVALADTILLLEKGDSRFGILETDIAIQLADQQLAKAFVRDDTNARSYAIQGKSFELKQEFDKAISSYDKAISINPSLAVAHMWQFLVYKKLNKHSQAMDAISKAYELDPLSISIINNYGLELTFRGEFEKSSVIFHKLLEEHPESPFGYAGLATHAFMQGNLAQSLFNWNQASKLSPENEAYKYNYLDTLTSLQLVDELEKSTDDPAYNASIFIIKQDYASLFEEMDFILQAYPDDPWVQFEAGWYQLLYGDMEQGISLILKANDSLSDEDLFMMPMCSPAIEVAWALQQKGEIEAAQSIISRCDTQAQLAENTLLKDNFVDYLQVRISVLNGSPLSEVKDKLTVAIEGGWREWWSEKDPILSKFAKTPELQSSFQRIKEQLAEQKQLAKTLLFASDTQQTEQH
ncbi:tetratricopeptide repeat protein [Aliiglaciecola aliphaticivorans]